MESHNIAVSMFDATYLLIHTYLQIINNLHLRVTGTPKNTQNSNLYSHSHRA